MGLQPLEFSDCINDSPYFREKLHTHEKELDRTSKAIKLLIAECKDVLNATRALSKAHRNFSNSLTKFKFDCIGNDQTDEEKVIECSLQEFGRMISNIEDERDKLLDQASSGIIQPLEMFRKDQLGAAKESKKRFDKETSRYCVSVEKYLNMTSKQNDNSLHDADLNLDLERKHFYEESMKYVLKLQEVQEKKKFEFVEILLSFMYRLMTFYHTGHEVASDIRPYLSELQLNIQRCRANFDTTRDEAETLMKKMLSVRGPQKQEPTPMNKTCTREGYLFLKEKKALGTTSWNKHYCQYQKENKILTMIPYNQVTGKGVSGKKNANLAKNDASKITTETMMVLSCTRRASDSIDRRFCFDLTVQDRQPVLTLQCLNEDDRRLWMDAMDGKEPIYQAPSSSVEMGSLLDDIGFSFIKRCTKCLEERGLEEQGLYRIVGVGSKVNKLLNMGLDRRKYDKLDLNNEAEWETKTVTSAIKNYFRSLPEPLMTFRFHKDFIQAAKRDTKTLRTNEVHELVHKLSEPNFEMLEVLILHLKRISAKSDQNLMTVGNLGVCFGPTLMRSAQESLASIMDIKWCNLVVEILIDNYDMIFKTAPQFAELHNTRVLNSSQIHSSSGDQQSSSSTASTTSINSNSRGQPPGPPPGPPPNHARHNPFNTPQTTVPHSGASPQRHSEAYYPSSVSSSLTSSPSLSSSFNNSNNQQPPPPQPPPPQSTGPPPLYANMTDSSSSSMSRSYDGLTYGQYKNQTRPKGGFYSQYSGDHPSSASSSTESLNSKCSSSSVTTTQSAEIRRPPPPSKGHVAQGINRFSQVPAVNNGATNKVETGHFVHRKRPYANSVIIHSINSSGGSMSGGTHHHHHHHHHHSASGKKVRTLYSCEAENESELSFEPNEIILNVRPSREPGWLEGSLNGKTGLIPANYVEYIN